MRTVPQFVKITLPAAIIVLAALGLAWLNFAPRSTPARTATLSELINEVRARASAQKAWEPASEGEVVRVGGGVRTGDGARARVDTSDSAIIRMAANSEFEFKELVGTEAEPVTRLTLTAGKLWATLAKTLGGGMLEIETPTGVATVRGSYMSVELTTAAEMVITCLEGQCQLAGASGKTTDLSDGQQAAIAGVGQDPSPAKPMDPAQYEDWTQNFPEAPVPTATPSPTPAPSKTPAPTLTPPPTETPIKVNMWCDLTVFLNGSTASFIFDAQVDGVDAAQVVAESPSGKIFTLEPFHDIYGGAGRFATLSSHPGLPEVGGTYTCTALDAAGAPIPGAVDSDVYVGGKEPQPPTNVHAEVVETGVLVSWTPSPVIPGAFDPSGSSPIGHYVIFLSREEGGLLFGWNSGQALAGTSHLIPLHHQGFGPDDTGLALDELGDGTYHVEVYARSMAPKETGGQRDECWAKDGTQDVRLVIEEGQVRVATP